MEGTCQSGNIWIFKHSAEEAALLTSCLLSTSTAMQPSITSHNELNRTDFILQPAAQGRSMIRRICLTNNIKSWVSF